MIYIPLCFFSVYFLAEKRKNKEIANIGSIITLYYILSSAFAIILYYTDSEMNRIELKLFPTLLYCFLLMITIHPFYKIVIRNKRFESIGDDNKTFKVISWILIILCLIFLVYISSAIIGVLRGDLGKIRYLSGVDENFRVVTLHSYVMPSYYAIYFSPILILFFFYSVSFMKNSTLFNILLIASSLVLCIYSIQDASRTQVIYWLMTGSVLFAIFYPHMPKRSRSITITLIFCVLIAAFIYLRLITTSRFGSGTGSSLISYIGQPYLQFSNIYNHYNFDGNITWDRTFPIISSFFNENTFDVRVYRRYHTARIGANTGVFLTFLGDAMLDFGKIGMVIYACIIGLIENAFVRRIMNKDFTVSNMVILTILFRIPLLGIFADMYLTKPTSIVIIGSLIIALVFSNVKIVIRASSPRTKRL